MAERMLQNNHIVAERWQIEELIGKGGFGEVYRCKDILRDRIVALKLVPKNPPNAGVRHLHVEANALRAVQGKKFFARYYIFGRQTYFDFLVMELLGRNLKGLKKEQPDKKLPIRTMLSMGRMMLKSVEWFHEAGYIHRDIKPSNFAVGVGANVTRVYLIDFGLAKKYATDGGVLLTTRNVSFKGTSRYASANVLHGKPPGRRDDLISLFYTLVELSAPKLPWKKVTDHKELAMLKESFNHSSLIVGFKYPSTLLEFFDHLRGLEIQDKPDYSYLSLILESSIRKASCNVSNVASDDTVEELDDLSDQALSQTMSTITGDAFEEELEETSSDKKVNKV